MFKREVAWTNWTNRGRACSGVLIRTTHPPIRIQQQVVTSWLWGSWWGRWWWRLWRWWWIDGGGGRCWWWSTRQPLGCTTHQNIMTSWLWAFWCTRGVINACLDGFEHLSKKPRFWQTTFYQTQLQSLHCLISHSAIGLVEFCSRCWSWIHKSSPEVTQARPISVSFLMMRT